MSAFTNDFRHHCRWHRARKCLTSGKTDHKRLFLATLRNIWEWPVLFLDHHRQDLKLSSIQRSWNLFAKNRKATSNKKEFFITERDGVVFAVVNQKKKITKCFFVVALSTVRGHFLSLSYIFLLSCDRLHLRVFVITITHNEEGKP